MKSLLDLKLCEGNLVWITPHPSKNHSLCPGLGAPAGSTPSRMEWGFRMDAVLSKYTTFLWDQQKWWRMILLLKTVLKKYGSSSKVFKVFKLASFDLFFSAWGPCWTETSCTSSGISWWPSLNEDHPMRSFHASWSALRLLLTTLVETNGHAWPPQLLLEPKGQSGGMISIYAQRQVISNNCSRWYRLCLPSDGQPTRFCHLIFWMLRLAWKISPNS